MANGFIRDAEEYVESAQLLIAAKGSGTKMPSYPSIYFLLSHAIELALKAYLAASAVPIDTLRNRIGHDLELALRCAQRHGFAPTAGFSKLVQWLAPYHLDHSFRYRKSHDSFFLPPKSEVAEIIVSTVESIEDYVIREHDAGRERLQRK